MVKNPQKIFLWPDGDAMVEGRSQKQEDKAGYIDQLSYKNPAGIGPMVDTQEDASCDTKKDPQAMANGI